MKIHLFKYSFILIVIVLGIWSCTKTKREDLKPAPSENIMQILEKDSEYSILVAALKRTELDKQLSSVGPYTIFAPTNQAFVDALGTNAATAINQVPISTLTRVLKYHIYMMRATSTTFTSATANANAALTGFLPSDNTYTTFVPSIADEAPTNEGYYNKYVYAYFGTMGGSLSINGIKPTKLDIAASNGIIHQIPRVAIPPTQTLSEFIANSSNLTKLKRAMDRIGFDPSDGNYDFSTSGAYTAFLPTDQAFTDAGFPDIASINSASIAVLNSIVRYHFIQPGNFGALTYPGSNDARMRLVFPSSSIANNQRFLTLNAPTNLTLRLTATVASNGSITLNSARPRTTDLFGVTGLNGNANNARVTVSDNVVLNGVAHIIDKVLDPTVQP